MSLFRTVVVFAALLLAMPSLAAAQDCGEERVAATPYVICTVDPAAADLRLFWADAEGRPYRGFDAMARAIETAGGRLLLAVNAGMYDTDFAPIGLYIEDGVQLRSADTTIMEGAPRDIPNFYKRPNGVFFIDAEGAGILTTDAWLAETPDARFATQSGPMLVIDGELHPALIPGSTDRTRRSGVGVCENGVVRFAVSNRDVNFHDFATLFRDHLGCDNALFLDGGRGVGLFLPEMRRNDFSWHGGYGPMFALVGAPTP